MKGTRAAPIRPFPLVSFTRSGLGVPRRVEGRWGVYFRCPIPRVGGVVGAPEGRGGSGDPSGCNPSALVSWERRVRPAPCVKNSGAAGATASSCCWRAGDAGPPGPRFGDRTGSRRGTRGEPPGPRNACAIFGVWVRAFPARGPGCESPDRGGGGFLVRESPTLPAPGLETPPRTQFRSSPAPAGAAEPPVQAPGELRSNLGKLAAGCAEL